MLRVIKETKPTWIVGENVAGFIPMALEEVLSSLEAEGYETQSFVIPACAVGAPHKRDRVWIVAHNISKRQHASITTTRTIKCSVEQTISKNTKWEKENTIAHATQHTIGSRDRRRYNGNSRGRKCPLQTEGSDSHAPDTGNTRLQESERPGSHGQGQATHGSATERNHAWNEPWVEVAQRFCCLHARIPSGLDGCLTLPETHGIMGLILLIRRLHYATTKENRPRKVLPILQEAFGEKSLQRCFGRLGAFFNPEVLRCPLHGTSYDERESAEKVLRDTSKEVSEVKLRSMQYDKCSMYSSQERGLGGQCSCEFDDIVCELSSEIALGEWKRNSQKAKNILYYLWKDSSGARFLYEPLSALYEIWQSITNYEVGAFRRHYNKRDTYRVQKLKALGNSIVPQVAHKIIKAIKDISDES